MRSPTPATSAPIAERFSACSANGATGAGCGVGLAVGGCRNATSTPHELQAEPCRCSLRVASIIERIDLGCGSNLMLGPSYFTAPCEQTPSCGYRLRDAIRRSFWCSLPKPDMDAGQPYFNRLDVCSPQGPPSQTAFQRWRAVGVSDAHRVKTNCSPYYLCKLIVHRLLNALHRGTARDDLTSNEGCYK